MNFKKFQFLPLQNPLSMENSCLASFKSELSYFRTYIQQFLEVGFQRDCDFEISGLAIGEKISAQDPGLKSTFDHRRSLKYEMLLKEGKKSKFCVVKKGSNDMKSLVSR